MNQHIRKEAIGASAPGIPAGRPDKPGTDWATIVLHWATAIAVVTSLITGYRIGGDAPDSVVGRALWNLLPQGEVWTWHFLASVSLIFCAVAYAIYMARSGLAERNAIRRLRVLAMNAPAKLRWNAVNVALHWAVYVMLGVLAATGIAIYVGYGGWIITVHGLLATTMLIYIGVHVVTHFLYGGVWQLLRLFRPKSLEAVAGSRRWPVLAGVAAALVLSGVVVATDYVSRDTLIVPRVAKAPVLTGKMDDPAWSAAKPVTILTSQGANLIDGTTTVEVRAVHDGSRVYFAFRWQDPTRSLMRLPLVKQADGWHMAGHEADTADVVDFYEDKLAVLFTHSDAFGNGGSTHMGPDPLPGMPKPFNGRGYHYTTDGQYADMWQWKASRGGMLGRVDDMYFGPPNPPTEAMRAGKIRYQAGYDSDPGTAIYVYNYQLEPPGGYRGPVTLLALPKDYVATNKAMGALHMNPALSVSEGSRWWMTEDETVPYSPEADAKIPVGTVIPGVLIRGKYTGDRADVTGASQWKDGWWTLETQRVLDTGSKYDIAFKAGEPVFMYVSAFDHTQTRHTRHMRPVIVTLRD